MTLDNSKESAELHFNRKNLLEKVGGNEDFLNEILEMVKSGLIKSEINNIEIKINLKEDITSIRKLAHKVKGSALGACFDLLADYSNQLEIMEPWNWEKANSQLMLMKDELKTLMEIIFDDQSE